MKIGIVTGSVWATKKCQSLTGLTLLIVRMGSETLVASDLAGAGTGDSVLVTRGSSAREANHGAPVDAAIVAILDQTEVSHERQ